jgi:hypothetical protein
MLTAVDQVLAGRYRLGASLGAGGMATVVAARDLRLERPVAVKLVPVSGIDPAGRARFVREARSSAGFSHPNAVAVYDAGEADGYLYLVMELVDGPSLATRLAERGRLDVAEAVPIVNAVLAALGAAHAEGIVHRDVKPGNILLGRGGAKLADFGIAKRLDDVAGDLTGTGQFVGTPKYLAPEQVMGRPATPASDLYAAGVVLYEMLAGRPPYEAATPLATAVAHRDEPIPDVRRLRPDVPDHVAEAVRQAMAKDPAARFESAAEMATALVRPEARPVAAVAGRPLEPTRVMRSVDGTPRRAKAWWWAVAAGLAVGAGAAYVLGQRGDDPNAGAGTVPGSTAPGGATVPTSAAPATVATPATTTIPPTTTTIPPTTTTPVAPSTVGELIAYVESFDEVWPKSEDFLRELRKLEEGEGRRQAEDAEGLLRRTEEWVERDELPPELVPLSASVLGPIAEGPGNSGDDDDDDD